MLKSSGALAGATLASRILGLARDTVYSNFMGTTAVASAFMLAFQVPNLFRRLLGEGALSGLFVSASIVSALAMIGISVALAFHAFRPDTELMLQLLRIMFPYTLLV